LEEEKKRISAQQIGKATYDASTPLCMEEENELEHMTKVLERRTYQQYNEQANTKKGDRKDDETGEIE